MAVREEEEHHSYPRLFWGKDRRVTLHSSSFHGGLMQCFAVEQGSSSALDLPQQRVPLVQSQRFLANWNLLIKCTILL